MLRLQNIQALRGVAVLSVVFFHLSIIEQKYGGSRTILPDFFQFGMFGVDLFFVISGFVMVTVTRDKFLILKQALRFIYHRAARIYPTYWFYTILALSLFLLQPSWVNSSQGNQVDILASFLLLPSDTLPLVMVGWTLIHEMYFYLAFFFILLLVSERRMPLIILSWGIGVAILNIYLQSNNPVIGIISHPLTIEFIGGCLLAAAYYRKNLRISNTVLIIILGANILVSLYGYHIFHSITGLIDPVDWWRVVIFGTLALSVVFSLVNAERNGHILHSSLITVGNASYSIYLSHIFTLSAVGRLWGMFSTDGVVDNLIVIPILLISVLVIGLISHLVIEKPLLEFSRRLA